MLEALLHHQVSLKKMMIVESFFLYIIALSIRRTNTLKVREHFFSYTIERNLIRVTGILLCQLCFWIANLLTRATNLNYLVRYLFFPYLDFALELLVDTGYYYFNMYCCKILEFYQYCLCLLDECIGYNYM